MLVYHRMQVLLQTAITSVKPGFHMVFVGLYGSLRVAGFAQSLSAFYDR